MKMHYKSKDHGNYQIIYLRYLYDFKSEETCCRYLLNIS